MLSFHLSHHISQATSSSPTIRNRFHIFCSYLRHTHAFVVAAPSIMAKDSLNSSPTRSSKPMTMPPWFRFTLALSLSEPFSQEITQSLLPSTPCIHLAILSPFQCLLRRSSRISSAFQAGSLGQLFPSTVTMQKPFRFITTD